MKGDLTKPSSLRLVSLVRWEQQIEECLTTGKPIPDEVYFLAGLQRIDQVFVFPDDHDLVIAGPAEGFVPDVVGRNELPFPRWLDTRSSP